MCGELRQLEAKQSQMLDVILLEKYYLNQINKFMKRIAMIGYSAEEIRKELMLVDEEVGLEIELGNLPSEAVRFEILLAGGSVSSSTT